MKFLRYEDTLSIPDHLKCKACGEPLFEPVEHPEVVSSIEPCYMILCKECSSNTKNGCPECHFSEWVDVKPGKAVNNMLFIPLSKLRVICKNCCEGTSRGELAEHIRGCPVDCILGCGKKIAPKDQEAHGKICMRVNVPCVASKVLCPWKGPRGGQEQHEESCPFVKLQPILDVLVKRVDDLTERVKQLETQVKK